MSKPRRTLEVGALILVLSSPTLGQSAECDKPEVTDRPRVGLVLGGGGARGMAHIGVIRLLEELRVPVDYVAGTSMGSIIGGLYATGMTSDEMEHVVTTADWDALFSDATAREDQPFRRKRDDDLALFGAKLGVGGESLLPAGAIGGQKITLLFESLTAEREQEADFNNLPIPFRAVAADVIDGGEVVIDHGDMATAMRASMSIPGVFDPVEYGDHLLVDGGIVANVPVQVVRDMGADALIAVSVGTPLLGREKLDNLLAITAQLSGILVVRNTEDQLATLEDRDVLIVPELGDHITSASFDKSGEAIPIGYQGALAVRDGLARYSISEQAYNAHRQTIASCVAGPPVIQWVRLENDSRFRDDVIEAKLNIETGQPLDVEAMEDDVGQIYALGFLQSVRYEVVKENDRTGVVVRVRQDERGTAFIEPGMDISSDGEDATIAVRVGYLKTDIDKLGSEFRGMVQLGQDPALLAELYKPMGRHLRYIFLPRFSAESRTVNEFDDDGNRLNEFRVRRYDLSVALGREFGRYAALSVGVRAGGGDIDNEVGEPFRSVDFDDGEYFVSLQYDRIDDRYFPTRGGFGTLEYLASRDELGADAEFEQAILKYFQAWSWGKHTVIGGVRYATTMDDDAPIQNLFRAGGFTRLSGYEENELSGQHFGLVLGGYRYQLAGKGLLPPMYVGANVEYGNAVNDRDDIFDEGIWNGSLYFGFNSPIGPLYIGYGVAEGSDGAYFMRIGNIFGRTSVVR